MTHSIENTMDAPDDVYLSHAVATFESRFSQVSDEIGFPCNYESTSVGPDGKDRSRAPNGADYSTVTSGGFKPGGQSQSWRFHKTVTAACDAWSEKAWAFANHVTNGKPVCLYWRQRPVIEISDDGDFSIWSRFSVGGLET